MLQKAKIHSLALLCVAAAVITASIIYRRRRRRRQSAVGRLCRSEFDEKPQNQFKRVLADNSYSGFKHYKREGKEKVSESSLKVHPFEEEITFLLENPPAPMQFAACDDKPRMVESYVWVSTEDQLESLVGLLSKEKVFAVDTEQHSVRSFLGFTALMQISTEQEDFLLDTIALHDVMSMLRTVFAEPSICKVFHGADNDVLWLQRDFHIYVVNMFDTAKACEVLLKPQKSLAYLLDSYCGVSTDKTFQREDWRLRPLTVEMIQYARTDAHYLLYIADRLVSELRNDNPACPDDEYSSFFETTRRSNMVCMQLYAKEVKSNHAASAAASIYSRMHNQELTPVKNSEIEERLRKLCAWRDLMARLHDESLPYALSDQAIAALAAKVPKDPIELLNAIQEADLITDSSTIAVAIPTPSHIVSTHADELCFLLHEVDININDILKKYLHMHLSPTGCCPMSIYNYALLSGFSLKQTNSSFSKQNGGRLNTQVGKKATRELFVQKFSCKSPVYHNCRIYANDGRLLCYCDRRKLEWYLKRELASIVEDDPPAIMLLFEPKGRPEDEGNDFYIHSKRNICVGCGEKSHYLRYRIIPSCYRMHFPEHLKSHRSHDIVLLCVDCHEIAHSAAEKYKRKVAAEFKIPLFVRKIIDPRENETDNLQSKSADGAEENGVSPLHLRTAAMALLRHGTSMPTKRRDELMQIVKKYFGGREISQEDLEMALLVGMSPHEIRRLEKKKGLKLKHTQTESFRLLEKNTCAEANIDDDLNNDDHNLDRSSEDGDTNDITNEQKLNLETEISNYDNNGSETPLEENGENDASYKSNQRYSSKNAKKFSLLGHGPHGKQVVDQILKSKGEEGISQFCQKWRQVFVEAVNPRFLPSGWDVLHSGRRDFGDFSVYNPAKKASGELTS